MRISNKVVTALKTGSDSDSSDDETKASSGRYTHIGHLVDLTLGQKNKEKRENALKFLAFFLKNQNDLKIKCVDDIKSMEDIDDQLMGAFSSFLALKATKYCLPNQPLIKYLTAYGYLSAMKMYFVSKFKNEPLSPVFEPLKFRSYLNAIFKAKSQQARNAGEVSPCLTEIFTFVHINTYNCSY